MHSANVVMTDDEVEPKRFRSLPRLRFVASWVLAIGLLAFGLPRVVDVSWHVVVPVLRSLHWPAMLGLVSLWLLGLFVHSGVLTAAAPSLTRRRALTLNLTGSAVANVVPLGGAAGVELNRRMMRGWGIDARKFAGFTFLTNLADIGSKLLLPAVAVIALVHAGESVTAPLRYATMVAGVSFVALAVVAFAVVASERWTRRLGRSAEIGIGSLLRLVRQPISLNLVDPLLDVRRECAELIAHGWLRMVLGITGYVALQGLLLGLCLNLTGAGVTWADVLAGFALERVMTIVPITPGGVGFADVGLVGILLGLGGNPAGVAAGAVLYRGLVFALEIPVGGGTLGLWLLGRRRRAGQRLPQRRLVPQDGQRIAHVTDVYLPRLGGIETHVDDLIRHQRARGIDAVVLTPTRESKDDPPWVFRMSAGDARRVVASYDVVHVHVSLFSPFGISVARAAIAAGIPTLVTVHSMWAGAGWLLRLASLAGLRRWPVVWSAVSNVAAESLRGALHGCEVMVLPNAIDIDDWRVRVDDRSGIGGDDLKVNTPEPITLVSVMRLMPRKRPLPLVRMFEQVRALAPGANIRLLIVGDGPQRHRVERYVRRHGLEHLVRVTGRIARTEVRRELASSSLYVAPAPKESFGIAALEARCAGLPVVAHRQSGVGEFVRDRVDGMLVTSDTEMAVAIAELVIDDSLRSSIAAHNRRVAPHFDWDDALDLTEAFYREAGERVAVSFSAVDPMRASAVVEA